MSKTLNSRQQRFCEFVIAGESQTDAYLKAGFKVPRGNARRYAARLMTNEDIKSQIAALCQSHTEVALRKKEANLRYLAAVIETPISKIGPDSPLCVEYVEEVINGGLRGKRKRGSVPSGREQSDNPILRRRVKKPCPLRAIEIYSKLLGHYEPDRVEVDPGPKTLQTIRERAHEVASALGRNWRDGKS